MTIKQRSRTSSEDVEDVENVEKEEGRQQPPRIFSLPAPHLSFGSQRLPPRI